MDDTANILPKQPDNKMNNDDATCIDKGPDSSTNSNDFPGFDLRQLLSQTDYISEDGDDLLDDIIYKSLSIVKDCVFSNQIEVDKLAEFMLKILTTSMDEVENATQDKNNNDNMVKESTYFDATDKIFNEDNNCKTIAGDESFYQMIDNFFGLNTAKTLNEKFCLESIDEIVENVVGKDAKQIICQTLNSASLGHLLNNIISDRVLPKDPNSSCDDLINTLLPKETEEFIKKTLEEFIHKRKTIEKPSSI